MTRDALTQYVPGQIIDTQRREGISNAGVNTSGTSGTIFCAGVPPDTPLALSYTPSLDCWWEVYAHLGYVNKIDAAYHYFYLTLVLAPADVDSVTTSTGICTQHSTVDVYVYRAQKMTYKLAANTPYTCTAQWSCNAGSWGYRVDKQNMWMEAKAWTR